MVQFWPKAKLWLLWIWLCIIIFWWINVFFSAKNSAKELQLEADVKNSIPEKISETLKKQAEPQEIIEEKKVEEEEWENKELSLLFPPQYSQEIISTFTQIIEENSWIQQKAKRAQTMEQYQLLIERLTQSDSASIDIVIAPSDRWQSFDWRWKKYAIPQQVERFYHSAFKERMYAKNTTVVPLWIDPLIALKKHWSFDREWIENAWDLLSYAWTLATWFDHHDTKHLTQRSYPFENAWTILEIIIWESLTLSSLDWIILLIKNNQWDWSKNNSISESHKERSVWFLSPLSLMLNENTSIHALPRSEQYPARGRGVILNTHSKENVLLEQWLQSVLRLSVETNTLPQPSWFLWATYSQLQRQLSRKELTTLQSVKNDFTLYEGTVEKNDDTIFTQAFIDTLTWIIDQKQFLQKMSNAQ